MTQAQDRINRSDRMQYISLNKKLVLGSETAAWWAVPYIAFAHGNLSVHNSIHWGFAKKRDLYGKYWPPARPEFFLNQSMPLLLTLKLDITQNIEYLYFKLSFIKLLLPRTGGRFLI